LKMDRPADGVGMAIEEAKRRAGLIAAPPAAPPPLIPDPGPAPVAAAPLAPVAPPAVEATPAPAKPARAARAKAPKATKRKPLSSAISAASARMDAAATRPAVATVTTSDPVDEAPVETPRRGGRKAPKSRQAASPAVAPAAVVPPPSPRRPRGPVPLAAWAHAVSDSPRPDPKRSEGKGLWRGIFRIPSEVALVEYGRGCRIHRLVIEAASESLVDPF
jgi:hypothetical protein